MGERKRRGDGLECPHCQQAGTFTVLRTWGKRPGIRRRRRCNGCGKTFLTAEHALLARPESNSAAKRLATAVNDYLKST